MLNLWPLVELVSHIEANSDFPLCMTCAAHIKQSLTQYMVDIHQINVIATIKTRQS